MDKYKPVCPDNLPLIEYLKHLQDGDKARMFVYKNAIKSICAFPIRVSGAEQAMQLKYIDRFIGDAVNRFFGVKGRAPVLKKAAKPKLVNPKKPKKAKIAPGPKRYIPMFRSGPYALVLAIWRARQNPDWPGFISKSQLQEGAQPLCDTSFVMTKDSSARYTAWNSMKTLKTKDLVKSWSNPAKYDLTDSGVELGKYLHDQSQNPDSELAASVAPTPAAVSENAGLVLLIDVREKASRSNDKQYIVNALKQRGIYCESRVLVVGDMLWVTRYPDGREVVMDYIVERKKVGDLVGSIKDGRYLEQKFRMKESGVPHIVYLIEGDLNGEDSKRIAPGAVSSSLACAEAAEGIYVHHTNDLDQSLQFLAVVTRRLKTVQVREDCPEYKTWCTGLEKV